MKLMFQGDSITDAGRDRSDNHNLSGYSLYIKQTLGDNYEYVNYACSGDTSEHMLFRYGYEFKKELPDVIFILIGINDIWRLFGEMSYQAVPLDKHISNCQTAIKISRDLKKDCKIVFLEPYVLPGPSNLLEDAKDIYPEMVNLLRKNIMPIVDKYVVLNDVLNEEYKKGNVYSDDGVHPNDNGHRFIANFLLNNLKETL